MIRSKWFNQIPGGISIHAWFTGVRLTEQRRQAVVVAQRVAAVALDAVGEQRRVIPVEQVALQPRAPLGVPVHGDHVGEIVGADPAAPAVPVEHASPAHSAPRQQKIPGVRVAVDDRDVVALEARGQSRRLVEQPQIEVAALLRKPVAESFAKPGEGLGESAEELRVRRGADPFDEPGIVPPGRMQARQCGDDSLALRRVGWHRRFCREHVRRAEILQQQVPALRCLVILRLEAARHGALRHPRGNAAVEFDFPLSRNREGLEPIWMTRLQDQVRRGVIRSTLIGEAQANDLRQDRVLRAFDRGLAHTAGAGQHTGRAQRLGQMLRVGGWMNRRHAMSPLLATLSSGTLGAHDRTCRPCESGDRYGVTGGCPSLRAL